MPGLCPLHIQIHPGSGSSAHQGNDADSNAARVLVHRRHGEHRSGWKPGAPDTATAPLPSPTAGIPWVDSRRSVRDSGLPTSADCCLGNINIRHYVAMLSPIPTHHADTPTRHRLDILGDLEPQHGTRNSCSHPHELNWVSWSSCAFCFGQLRFVSFVREAPCNRCI